MKTELRGCHRSPHKLVSNLFLLSISTVHEWSKRANSFTTIINRANTTSDYISEHQVTTHFTLSLLPPASEGWGKGLFSVCLSVHTLMRRGYSIPGLDRGDTLSKVQVGVPHLVQRGVSPSSWWGVPHPRSKWGVPWVQPLARTGWVNPQRELNGVPPGQDWMG